MEKNKEYCGLVCGLGTEGEGIVKTEGTTAFVPYCLTGEQITYKALKVTSNVAYGKCMQIHVFSPLRVEPVCAAYERCGGCQLQHMHYDAQLAFKQESVAAALKKIGGIEAEVNACVPADMQLRYRNKLALPVGWDGQKTVIGFYAARSHRIVPIEDCPIQAPWVKSFIALLRKFMQEQGLRGYDEVSKKGDIRHAVVREMQGAFVVTLVVTKVFNTQKLQNLLGELFQNYTLLLNVNTAQGNAIFTNDWHICHGEGFFTAEEEGVKYKAGANTFLQVNDGVRSKLYAAVKNAAKNPEAVALDLYSGGGMLTAMLARACKCAYGVEVVKEASICADELKEMNGLQGKMFNICGKVEDKIAEVIDKVKGAPCVAVCDPPRKGMEKSVILALKKAAPEKIVLVSCNPATLARDLGILLGSLTDSERGLIKTPDFNLATAPYQVESITPFDMFPQTKHVETVVVLNKNF